MLKERYGKNSEFYLGQGSEQEEMEGEGCLKNPRGIILLLIYLKYYISICVHILRLENVIIFELTLLPPQ